MLMYREFSAHIGVVPRCTVTTCVLNCNITGSKRFQERKIKVALQNVMMILLNLLNRDVLVYTNLIFSRN